jgi:hypothetical protein
VGVFEFLAIAVVVSTIGKVVSVIADRRALPPAAPSSSDEVEALRDAVGDLGTRLDRLEEERDFYKALLDAPPKARSLQVPDVE